VIITVTGDWHFRTTGMFSRPLSDGLTTAAEAGFEFLNWLDRQMARWDSSVILHCGDLFDQRTAISIPLYNRTLDELSRFLEGRIMLVIPGNHDRYSRSNDSIHSIYVLGQALDNLKVLDGTPITHFNLTAGDEDLIISGIPAGVAAEAIKGGSGIDRNTGGLARRILMIHENIVGAKFESGKRAEKGIVERDLREWMRQHRYTVCFCGDIHIPRALNRAEPEIIMVGAPYGFNFGDAGQNRGVWKFDTDTGVSEPVWYEDGPIYMTATDENFDETVGLMKDIFDAGRATWDVFVRFRLRDPARVAEAQKLKERYTNILIEYREEDDGRTVEVGAWDESTILAEYVAGHVEDEETARGVLEIGLYYLEEV